jgi:hypothetical protein
MTKEPYFYLLENNYSCANHYHQVVQQFSKKAKYVVLMIKKYIEEIKNTTHHLEKELDKLVYQREKWRARVNK